MGSWFKSIPPKLLIVDSSISILARDLLYSTSYGGCMCTLIKLEPQHKLKQYRLCTKDLSENISNTNNKNGEQAHATKYS